MEVILKSINFKLIIQNNSWDTPSEIAQVNATESS